MQSVLTHPALISIPAAFAVIIISGMFLNHLTKLGKSRDAEREASMQLMQTMGTDFTKAMKELNDNRAEEQAQQFEFYRLQSLCMQEIVAKCGGKMPKLTKENTTHIYEVHKNENHSRQS